MPRGPILIPLVSRPASGPAGTACQAPTTGRGGAGERTRTSTPWGDRDLNPARLPVPPRPDRKSTRLNSSHVKISYAVFCLKKKKKKQKIQTKKKKKVKKKTL